MVWERSGMSSVLAQVAKTHGMNTPQKSSSTTTQVTRGCTGNLVEPLQEERCIEIIRKLPKTLCNTKFTFRKSSNIACRTFCPKHVYCFFPLPDGSRCTNIRNSIEEHYCKLHAEKEKTCGALVANYKKVCGRDPISRRCKKDDSIDSLEEKEDLFSNCFKSRVHHHQKCIHPSAQSSGHLHFLQQTGRFANECRSFLWHEPGKWPEPQQIQGESDGWSETESDSSLSDEDIFYDFD